MIKKITRYSLGYIGAVCVLLWIISHSVIFPTFFVPFYRWHYQRVDASTGMDIAQTIGMTHEDLMYVTVELLNYMRGRRDSLEGLSAHVDGHRAQRTIYENFFTDLEIRHMVDVRVLYDRLFMLQYIALGLFLAINLALYFLKDNLVLVKCTRHVLGGFLALAVVMTGIISINFERAWDIFHYIFFDNDYWRLTPFRDLMINMVPLHFFLHISIFIGILLAVKCTFFIALSTWVLRK